MVNENSFDAWERKRNIFDWNSADLSYKGIDFGRSTDITPRSYTGHSDGANRGSGG